MATNMNALNELNVKLFALVEKRDGMNVEKSTYYEGVTEIGQMLVNSPEFAKLPKPAINGLVNTGVIRKITTTISPEYKAVTDEIKETQKQIAELLKPVKVAGTGGTGERNPRTKDDYAERNANWVNSIKPDMALRFGIIYDPDTGRIKADDLETPAADPITVQRALVTKKHFDTTHHALEVLRGKVI